VSAASREQSAGIEQTNKALQDLDHVTQQNASAAEQMAATSAELSSQAQQLQTAIGFFRSATSTMTAASSRRAARRAPHRLRPRRSRSTGSVTTTAPRRTLATATPAAAMPVTATPVTVTLATATLATATRSIRPTGHGDTATVACFPRKRSPRGGQQTAEPADPRDDLREPP
jgi:hypothetical protein